MVGLALRAKAVVTCFLWTSLVASGQDPVHRQYTVSEGLPSNTIYCAVQDREGFMWFGTASGAVRFDGHDFRVFSMADGLSDAEVLNIVEDSKGRMWFLTLNGKLCYYWNGRMHNAGTDAKLARFTSQSGWQSFVEDTAGMLWFGGVTDEVLRLDLEGDADRLWRLEAGAVSVLLDEENALIIERSGLLSRNRGERWEELGQLARFGTAFLYPPVREGDGPITLTRWGIEELRYGRWSVVRDVGSSLDQAIHNGCWRDLAGDIWIRRTDAGVDLLEPGTTKPRRIFPDGPINYVYLDREGNRWFCTRRKGVFLVNAQQWSARLFSTGRTDAIGFRTLLLDREGRLWAGTDEGGIHQARQDDLGPDLGGPRLGRVMRFAQGHDGTVYVATDGAVLRIDPETGGSRIIPSWCTDMNGKWDPAMIGAKSLAISPDGSLWISYFGVWRAAPSTDMLLEHPAGLDLYDRIPCLHVDPSGTLWFAVVNALYSWQDGRSRDHPAVTDHLGLRITDLVDWSPDTLLIATSGAGLKLFSEGQLAGSFTIEDGLVSDDIRRARWCGDTLLVSTGHGLSIGIRAGGTLRWSRMTRSHGLPTNEVNDAVRTAEGLYVATDAGLCKIPWTTTTWEPGPLRIHFVSVLADGLAADTARTIELAENSNRLAVRFNAITFAEPERVEYQYRLRDNDPWATAAAGLLELASLSAGKYRLAVRARRPQGDWSAPVLLPIIVQAAWWNTTLARVVMVALLLALLVMISRVRLQRRYRRVVTELHARQTLNDERSRIAADIHDDLGADLSRLLLYARHSEAASIAEGRLLTDGLNRAIDKMDEIIWALDPRRDTLQSTIQFIEQQARESADAHGLKFRAEVRVPRTSIHLAAGHRRELMLLAREAIRNVMDHALASTLRVEWMAEDDAVRLTIQDDGKGFDERMADPGRHGLGNMRERAGRLGGTLYIERSDPNGTRVRLRFPLPGITRSDDAPEEKDVQLGP